MSAPFKRVMAAIDPGDDLAPAVVRTALNVAADGARLFVVSSINTAPLAYPAPEPAAAAAFEAARQSLNDAHDVEKRLRAMVEEEAPGAQFETAAGGDVDAVLERADALDIDLIVLGTHRKGFWERLLSGSRSNEVVQRARTSLLLVPSGADATVSR
ncbi:MAG: hypothetical protein GC206_01485 [Alphaproteobacteria bacterium]|nr:hypothetical protein [Alphaproteobacteria bacterium]